MPERDVCRRPPARRVSKGSPCPPVEKRCDRGRSHYDSGPGLSEPEVGLTPTRHTLRGVFDGATKPSLGHGVAGPTLTARPLRGPASSPTRGRVTSRAEKRRDAFGVEVSFPPLVADSAPLRHVVRSNGLRQI